MNFKKSVLASALALALLPLASNAATAPTDPYQTPDATIYLSGASAPDTYLAKVLTSMFTGTVYHFKDNGPTIGAAFNAYYGTVANATTDTIIPPATGATARAITQAELDAIPASLKGKRILLIKRSAGGSVMGVNPVAREAGIKSLHIGSVAHSSGAAGCAYEELKDGSGASFSPKQYSTNVLLCSAVGDDLDSAAAGNMIPDFGVSDVAPNMFKQDLNVEFQAAELDYEEASRLTTKGLNTLMMGYAMTKAVPQHFVTPANFGAMLSGNITTWSKQGVAMTAVGGQSRDGVVICRRYPGSGTQAAYNWYFNNFPCTNSSVAGSGDTEPAKLGNMVPTGGTGTENDPFILATHNGATPTPVVIENSGSGDVRSCLLAAQGGGDYKFQAPNGSYYKVAFGSGGFGAIGVLSLDSHGKESAKVSGATAATVNWTFRSVYGEGELTGGTSSSQQDTTGGGIHPTQENLLQGRYDFAAELTMQYLATRVPVNTVKFDFISEIIKRAGQPERQSKATAAIYPNATPVVSAAGLLTSTNIARATRSGNMCKPLVKNY